MPRSLMLLVLIFLAPFINGPAAFATTTEGSNTATYSSLGTPSINFDVRWKVWILAGEPVYDANIRWNFLADGEIRNPEDKDSFIPFWELPDAAIATIRLYEAKVKFRVHRKGAPEDTGVFTFDIGIPAKAGSEWSYNTPTSPDWDELLETHWGYAIEYKTKEAAQAMVKSGFVVDGVDLVDAKFAYYNFDRWWFENNSHSKAERLSQSIAAYIGAIKNLAGLPVEKLTNRLEELDEELAGAAGNELSPIIARLEEFNRKLSQGVPAEFISPVRRAPYEHRLIQIHAAANQQSEQANDEQDYDAWRRDKQQEIDERELPEVVLTAAAKKALSEDLIGFWHSSCDYDETYFSALRFAIVNGELYIIIQYSAEPSTRYTDEDLSDELLTRFEAGKVSEIKFSRYGSGYDKYGAKLDQFQLDYEGTLVRRRNYRGHTGLSVAVTKSRFDSLKSKGMQKCQIVD